MHRSVVTRRFQATGLLFLATENRENVQQGLDFFKQSLGYTQEDLNVRFHFLVDKDFDYIEVLLSIVLIFWFKIFCKIIGAAYSFHKVSGFAR